MMEFYNRTKPKARKDHVCEYCGQTIHKGEIYSYETGKYDGDMFARKLCLTCENILDTFCKENGEDEFSWDWITDWLSDCYCYNCEHGRKGKDDCEHDVCSCPLIRKEFTQKNDNERYCTNCKHLSETITCGVCEKTNHKVVKTEDNDFAENCDLYESKYKNKKDNQ